MFHFSHIFYQNLTDLQKEEVKVLKALWETFYQSFFIEFEENSNICTNNFLFKDEEEDLIFYAKEIFIKGKKTFSVAWHPKVEGQLSYFFNLIKSNLEEKTYFCLNDSFPSFFLNDLKIAGFKEFLKEDILIFSSKLKFVRDKEEFLFYEEMKEDKLFLEVIKQGQKIASFEYYDKEGFNLFFDLKGNFNTFSTREDKIHIFSKSLALVREKGFRKDISVFLEQDISLLDILLNSGFRKATNLSLWVSD